MVRQIKNCPVCDDFVGNADNCEVCGWQRGTGRLKLDESDKTVLDGFKIPSRLKEAFNKRLAQLKKNKSEVIRGMIKDWLEAHKTLKKQTKKVILRKGGKR